MTVLAQEKSKKLITYKTSATTDGPIPAFISCSSMEMSLEELYASVGDYLHTILAAKPAEQIEEKHLVLAVFNVAADMGGVCSIEQVGDDITFRNKGKTTFTNVTAELLTIVLRVEVWVDLNGDGLVTPDEVEIVYARIPIFDDILQGEYWEYDQGDPGLQHLQVRFYPIETDVSAGDGDLPPL